MWRKDWRSSTYVVAGLEGDLLALEPLVGVVAVAVEPLEVGKN